jgi:hypothetical protein
MTQYTNDEATMRGHDNESLSVSDAANHPDTHYEHEFNILISMYSSTKAEPTLRKEPRAEQENHQLLPPPARYQRALRNIARHAHPVTFLLSDQADR